MAVKFGIGGLVSSHFFEVAAGRESDAVLELRKQEHRFLFKALGSFDLISFSEADTFDDRHLYTSCEGVTADCVVGAYRICTDGYESPRIQDWIRDKPIIGYVALELDKLLYTPNENGEGSGLEACMVIVNCLSEYASKNMITLSIFGGFGRSELFALVGSNRFEDVWRFTTFCRRLRIMDCFACTPEQNQSHSVFASTVTTPAISYDVIGYSNESGTYSVSGVDGECQASIAVTCPPGFEAKLQHLFPDRSKYSISASLGSTDCHINTCKKEPTKEVLEAILNFRKTWSSEVEAPISTVTTVLFEQEDVAGNGVTTYRITNASDLLVSLIIPDTLRAKSPRLANRVNAFEHRFNACIHDRSLLPAVTQLLHYMEYIQSRLNAYAELAGSRTETVDDYNCESSLLEALESAEIGLAQRVDNTFDAKRSPYQMPAPFGDGIFSSLIAVRYLTSSITKSWPSTNGAGFKDYGFPVFSDSFGFQVRYGEVMFLPLAAIYDCASASGNWLTLTHELSHLWYLRLRVAEELRDEYARLQQVSFGWRGDSTLVPDIPIVDQLNELFAHWFDYYHFFDCDIDLYLTSIWRSWLHIPIVHRNFPEYMFRSYVVFLISDMNDLYEASKGISSTVLSDYLSRRWSAHIDRLRVVAPTLSPKLLQGVDSQKSKFINLFHRYAPILILHENKYGNEEFRSNLNKPYERLDADVQMILKGQVVLESIPNPFNLCKTVIRANIGVVNRLAPLALILSLKNQDSWLTDDGASGEADASDV